MRFQVSYAIYHSLNNNGALDSTLTVAHLSITKAQRQRLPLAKELCINTPLEWNMRMGTSLHCCCKTSYCPNHMTVMIESSLAVDHDCEATGSGR
jgi:hypothetical protein